MIGEFYMFVVSVKSDFIKKISLCVIVAVFAIIGGTIAVSNQKTATVGNFSDVPLDAETHEQRADFFRRFGWEIADEPSEVKRLSKIN